MDWGLSTSPWADLTSTKHSMRYTPVFAQCRTPFFVLFIYFFRLEKKKKGGGGGRAEGFNISNPIFVFLRSLFFY